uniref:Threonylcarbamoyl-AMP synthase n=1 Tax=uncultured Verrucomicrobiales bacterium HF0130_14P10 TaxID=723606 RepID=E7C2L7_9BACT|nr:putative translation factor (SUA5) [uncultured Verrucomicrobiales bacterium HF0130_14P10]
MQKHYGVSPEELSHVAGLLHSGQIVALPTETVYGLACLALNKLAVAKVFEAKQRPINDPLIIHVSDLTEAQSVCRPDHRAILLSEVFWPGPLTLVLPKTKIVPTIVTSGLSTVAVRSPANPVFREILNLVSAPLAAPSANPFGKISPTRAEHIKQSFGDEHPPVVDGGPTKLGIESTVVDLSSSRTRILRPGPIDREAISAILGEEPEIPELKASSDKPKKPLSPGLLAKHYQPESPLQVFSNTEDLMAFLKMEPSIPAATFVITHSPLNENCFPSKGLKFMHLSEFGDPEEIAKNLFARLREADAHSPPLILCPLLPETGIGSAVNDRLRKASFKD